MLRRRGFAGGLVCGRTLEKERDHHSGGVCASSVRDAGRAWLHVGRYELPHDRSCRGPLRAGGAALGVDSGAGGLVLPRCDDGESVAHVGDHRVRGHRLGLHRRGWTVGRADDRCAAVHRALPGHRVCGAVVTRRGRRRECVYSQTARGVSRADE